MRAIIAGSRDCTDRDVVGKAVAQSGFDVSLVISGAARGVDRLGEDWAAAHGKPVERYPADWDTHGRSAGPIRNAQMADVAEVLIAVWDGQSRGTKNMIDTARRKGLMVYVYLIQ